jgi:two-component system cell cycle sensor histidine kinase/response regulator CckA
VTDSHVLAGGGQPPMDAPRASREEPASPPDTRAEPPRAKPVRSARAFDPLFLMAALLFTAALGAAAYPAFRADPSSGPGMLLLMGLAGVALLGVFAFRGGEGLRRTELTPDRLIDALDEPAALVAADGRIVTANRSWRAAAGDAPRLPRGPTAPGVFVAMAQARKGATGRALVRLGDQDFEAVVSLFSPGRFLVRAAAEGVLAEPLLLAYAPQSPNAATVIAAAAPAVRVAAPGERGHDPYAGGAPFGAAVLDRDDPFEALIVETNSALAALTGGRALAGVRFADLLEPSGLDDARAKIAAGSTGPIEIELALEPRRAAHLYLSSDQSRRLVYVIDVSEQKQLELHLAQARKMEAIGQLAGGVAHDFNNLLTAIQLRLDELLARHPVGDPSYEGLNEIRQTGVRAADLVRKLLAFSRKQTVKRQTLELGELISEFEVLLRRLLREDVKLETEYGRDLPRVHADKSQLETAVMNLAVNARDAMRGQGGGVVRIKTARVTLAEARAMGWADAPQATEAEDDCALIEVSDTGPGIPQELASKVFEPFFTTKAVGEGTGMGLATVYGIVDQADGCIVLESKPGEGATFRIFLPAYTPPAKTAAEEAAALVVPVRPVARDLSGAGKILFVEDEDMVRGVAARLLRDRGYDVIEASDGEEALLLAEANSGSIDMMISDVIMPGMDGPSLLKRARQYLGGAPVMFISGYAEAEFSDLLEGETGVSFLPKPLDIKTLAERVKQELRAA